MIITIGAENTMAKVKTVPKETTKCNCVTPVGTGTPVSSPSATVALSGSRSVLTEGVGLATGTIMHLSLDEDTHVVENRHVVPESVPN